MLTVRLLEAEEKEIDLRGETYTGEQAGEAHYAGGTIDGCRFSACHFPKACFTRTMFFGCRFENCDLSGVDFRACSFKDTVFSACRLTGADFRDASLSGVELSDCVCAYTNHASALYKKCRLTGGSFQEASFFQTEFRACSLETDFTLAEFQRAQFGGADLRKCDLYGAIFTPDTLRGVTVTREQAADLAKLLGLIIS